MNLHPGDWFSQNVALAYNIVTSDLNPDLIVVDHSASCVPILKWRFPQSKVLFYCHFPQQLVTPSRFFLYRWYSNLIGLIEAKLYEFTDVIMVNSKFTAESFAEVMPSISKNKIRVVYPPCDVDSLSVPSGVAISRKKRPQNDKYVFLSMNRFWPEKRLDIIVEAAGESIGSDYPIDTRFPLGDLIFEFFDPDREPKIKNSLNLLKKNIQFYSKNYSDIFSLVEKSRMESKDSTCGISNASHPGIPNLLRASQVHG